MAEPARITRSAKRVAAEAATPSRAEPVDSPTPAGKRVKFETTPSGPADSASRVRQVIADVELEQIKAELAQEEEDLAHPPLTFDYAHARTHLIGLDERWRHWMDRLKCKPFEEPEIYNPFRSLVVSIIGQQISFLAARSVTHRFTRIWFPHLPEKLGAPTIGAPAPVDASPFPTPHQVAAVDVDTLRAAGLSGRKVEYIQGLAGYFVRGEITARGLLGKDDDEVRKTLLAVRGIGPWTIDMFLIFTARRPDVLPVGDLGIQKNLVLWYSAAESTKPLKIHPAKLAEQPREATPPPLTSPFFTTPVKPIVKVEAYPTPISPLAMSKSSSSSEAGGELVFPVTSNGLTPAILKARLTQKLKGKIYLTPNEMLELTESWRPYRSIACYYLWSIQDGEG